MIFNTWKTSDKETPINEMDKLFVLKAAKQCIRKLHYYDAKMNFLRELRKEKKYLYSMCTVEIKTLFNKSKAFAHLLEQMDNRAAELGFEMPESIDDITALILSESNTPKSINEPEVVQEL